MRRPLAVQLFVVAALIAPFSLQAQIQHQAVQTVSIAPEFDTATLDYRVFGPEKLTHRNRGTFASAAVDADHIAAGNAVTVGEGVIVVAQRAYPFAVTISAGDLTLYEALLVADHPTLHLPTVRNMYLSMGLKAEGSLFYQNGQQVLARVVLKDRLGRVVTSAQRSVQGTFPALQSAQPSNPVLQRDCVVLAQLLHNHNIFPNVELSDKIRDVNGAPIQADETMAVSGAYLSIPGTTTLRDFCASNLFLASRTSPLGWNLLLQAPSTPATNPAGFIVADFFDPIASNPSNNLIQNNFRGGSSVGANSASDIDFANFIAPQANGGQTIPAILVTSDNPAISSVIYRVEGLNPIDGGMYTTGLPLLTNVGIGRLVANTKRGYGTYALLTTTSVRSTADVILVNAASTFFGCRPGVMFLKSELVGNQMRWTEKTRDNLRGPGGAALPLGTGCNATSGPQTVGVYGTDLAAGDLDNDGDSDMVLVNTSGSGNVVTLLQNQGSDGAVADEVQEYWVDNSLLPNLSDARVTTAILPRVSWVELDPLENRGFVRALVMSTVNNGLLLWVFAPASGWQFIAPTQLPAGNFNDILADAELFAPGNQADKALDLVAIGNGAPNNGVFFGDSSNPVAWFNSFNLGSTPELQGLQNGNLWQSVILGTLQTQGGNTFCDIWQAPVSQLSACINASPGAYVTLTPFVAAFANNQPGAGYSRGTRRYTRGMWGHF